jgi:hypothetical protein
MSFIEHGWEVSLKIYIRQVMGSNLASDTEYFDRCFLETTPRLGDDYILSNTLVT